MQTILRAVLCAAMIAPLAPALARAADDATVAAPADAPANALSVTGRFSRATRPGAPVAGGFMTITNTTAQDDRLIGAHSAVAGTMQIHETAMADGVMKMREMADGLPIPAGKSVALKPGGYHVMFMDLKQPLVQGETIDVTLVFQRSGEVDAPLVVLAPDAESFVAGN